MSDIFNAFHFIFDQNKKLLRGLYLHGIALTNGFVAQFATSGSHIRLFDTRKTIIFIGRAPSAVLTTHATTQYYAIITGLIVVQRVF